MRKVRALRLHEKIILGEKNGREIKKNTYPLIRKMEEFH